MLTALYRHFNAAGVLLYAGISLRPTYRLRQHGQAAHWSDDIKTVTIEWLPSRAAAIEAERKAIAREQPLHNLQRPAVEDDEPAPVPELKAPVWVDRPEFVAAHFAVSIGTVQRMKRQGMPHEKINGTRSRYDLAAIGEWLKERARAAAEQQAAAKRAASEARNLEACRIVRDAWSRMEQSQ